MILIETQISDTMMPHVLNDEFTENEIKIILDRQIRTILNMQETQIRHKPFEFGLLETQKEILVDDIIKKQLISDNIDFY